MDRFPSTPRPATIGLQISAPSYLMKTHSKKRQSVGQGAQEFALDLQFPPLTRAEFGPIMGFLAAQEGRAGVFEYAPHTKASPLGLGSAGAQSETNNQVLWSERLDLSPWSMSADTTVVGGATDPTGGAMAQLVTIDAANIMNWPVFTQVVGALSGSVVASVYMKQGTATRSTIIFRDTDIAANATIQVAWSSGVPSLVSALGVDAYGMDDVGNSWWRLWVAVDLASNNQDGHSFNLNIYPRVLQPGVTATMYIWGAQVSTGGLTPADYLHTWGTQRSLVGGPRFSAVRNDIEVSYNLNDAYWTKGGAVAPATGPEFKQFGTDPEGGNTAQSWGTPPDNGIYVGSLSKRVVASSSATQYVLSCYVRKHTADRCAINLYEPNSVTSHLVHVDFDSAGVGTIYNPVDVDAYGLEDVGVGWYRVWLMLDAENRGIVDVPLDVYLYPHREDDGDPREPDGSFMWGVQLETDRTAPGHYLSRLTPSDPSYSFDSGIVLHTEGWSPGQAGVLKAGDIVKVSGQSNVFVVTTDVDSDSNGLGVVEVRPQLPGTIYPDTALQVENIVFEVYQDSDVMEMPADGNDFTIFRVRLREAL